MMRWMIGLGAILGLLQPGSVLANWVEARSENFIFYGEASPKRAEKILSELEEYRAILFTFYGAIGEQEALPVRVYATKSSSDIEAMTGSENAAGVYAVRRESPLFILNIKGGFHNGSPAKTIALHEYTHHLLDRYTNQMYPRWVNEGMAEYLSTFAVSDRGVVEIGLPREGRAYALANYDWMDWDILTGAIRRYPYGNASGRTLQVVQSLFYAQSWLAVHYMISHPEFSQKLTAYVEGAPQANDAKVFFTEVFGMDPDQFGEQMRAYYRKNRYPGKRITLDQGVNLASITTRKLSKAERDFHRGEAVRQFRVHREESRELARKYYDRAEKALDGNTALAAQIAASRALIAIADDNSADALAQIERAQTLDADNARIKHVAAAVALARYEDPDVTSTTADMDRVRSLFKDALRAEPSNMEAHFDYVMTYVDTGDPPSKQAVYSAVECSHHYRSTDLFADNMRLIPVLMRGGETDVARYHMQRAALWGPNARARSQARRMLESMK